MRVRILVVDDRPENLLAIESVLQDASYELVLARSGREALKFLLHGDCAVILLDVQMPEMDGFEVARLVRGSPRAKSIPIVFMTAVSQDEPFIQRGYDLGAIDYLLKPVDPHVLRCKVAAFAELHRAREEMARQAALLRERDSAERQRAVEQLELRFLRRQQAASERHRRLMDGITHAVVWSADPLAFSCTLVSKSTEALLGRGAEAWIRPGAWDELVPPADRARFLEALRAAAAGEEVALDHGFVRADGSIACFRTTIRSWADGEQDRPELRGFSVDVTDARRAEEALAFLARASVELFSSLQPADTARTLASLAVPFLADACGVTLRRGDEEIRASIPENAPAALKDGAGRDAPDDGTARMADGAWSLGVPVWSRGRAAGSVRLLRSGARPFDARDVQVARDLADRAGRALENAILYEEAQEAIQLREEFISIASHELRTPLTALTLQARLMERAVSGDDPPSMTVMARRIASVVRQVDRMSQLVANVLDVTRLRIQRLELSRERFDLCGLVDEVAGRFQEELDRAGRLLRVSAAGPALGFWDRTKLEQVVNNLVSNAIRYGGDGPIDVTLRNGPGEVSVAVQDRGRGIAPEDQARIFRRFERGQNAGASGGLGLGLYVVRHIVEAHGGRIEVASAVGAGTVFTVTLPLDPGAELTPASPG